ncbi:LuxR C-terminal-related transcriptional regulator [Blastococcus deserti]|uniref:LuxR C-terminal-related transcriptional regulator n=1 Tax=Blastococcus deserti TaxID=2259033 RepID=A0ABW4XE31_9ACTN
MGGHLDAARGAYARRDWLVARDEFGRARAEEELSGDDLYAFANTYWWLGQLEQALPALAEAHRALLAEGRRRTAAMVALDTGYTYGLRGEEAQGSGWISRGVRLLEREGDCAERGYLLYCDGEGACTAHDLERALALAGEVLETGRRFGDRCLVALGVLLEGRVRVKRGEVEAGLALLDEAMVAAVSDDLDPGWAGNIYCNLMLTCWEVADWHRAGEWTAVTARWCEAMPGAGPFMGICRVHRAQVLQMRGDWAGAESEVRRVCDELTGFHVSMLGEAHYQLGELARRRGDLAGAETAYADAHRRGRDPQPGLALLRLAQGRPASAAAMVTRALTGAGADSLARARLLPAAVEILLAVGDLGRARHAVDELGELAARYPTAGLRAVAATAGGAVALDAGDTATACALLREAVEAWQRIGARCETAHGRLLLARALAGLGDVDSAAIEREAGLRELRFLGAPRPREAPKGRSDGLSAREVEVLRLVADGRSNEEIAETLVLSVRTVERHLATAYQKLGLHGRSARAAAACHILGTDAVA